MLKCVMIPAVPKRVSFVEQMKLAYQVHLIRLPMLVVVRVLFCVQMTLILLDLTLIKTTPLKVQYLLNLKQ